MSLVSLLQQEQATIRTSNSKTDPSPINEKMYVSPSGSLLAITGSKNISIQLYNTSTNIALDAIINHKILDICFTVDDSAIIYNIVIGVIRYFIGNRTEEVLVPSSRYNKFQDIELSPDGRTLFMLNVSASNSSAKDNKASRLVSFDLSSRNITSVTSTGSCNAINMTFHRQSQTLVTSSFNCIICKWKYQGSPIIIQSQAINDPLCLMKEIFSVGEYIALTRAFNRNKKHRVYLFDFQTLDIVGASNTKSYQIEGLGSAINNKFISYAANDRFFYIFSDIKFTNSSTQVNNITSVPFIYNFTNGFIRNVQYSSIKDKVFVSMVAANFSEKMILTYYPTFQCDKNGKNNNAFQRECPCPTGEMFDKLSSQCIEMDCSDQKCSCPPGQKWTQYGLMCELDCGAIKHSAVSTAFGNPPQCYCALPYAWNPAVNDCSHFDCSYLPQAKGSPGKTCQCKQGFSWNTEANNCQPFIKPTPVTPITPVVIQAPNPPSIGLIVGAIVLIILIVIVGAWFYFKKCRKSPQKEENSDQNEPKESERGLKVKGITPRQQELICDLQSNEQLDAKDYRSEKSDNRTQKASTQPDQPEPAELPASDIQNFSICEYPQMDALSEKFSEIESHIEKPLQ